MPNLIDPKCSKELSDEDLKQVSGGDIDTTIKYEYAKGTWFKQQTNRMGTIKTYIYRIDDFAGADVNGPIYKCSIWFEKILGKFAGPNTDYIGQSILASYSKQNSKPGEI